MKDQEDTTQNLEGELEEHNQEQEAGQNREKESVTSEEGNIEFEKVMNRGRQRFGSFVEDGEVSGQEDSQGEGNQEVNSPIESRGDSEIEKSDFESKNEEKSEQKEGTEVEEEVQNRGDTPQDQEIEGIEEEKGEEVSKNQENEQKPQYYKPLRDNDQNNLGLLQKMSNTYTQFVDQQNGVTSEQPSNLNIDQKPIITEQEQQQQYKPLRNIYQNNEGLLNKVNNTYNQFVADQNGQELELPKNQNTDKQPPTSSDEQQQQQDQQQQQQKQDQNEDTSYQKIKPEGDNLFYLIEQAYSQGLDILQPDNQTPNSQDEGQQVNQSESGTGYQPLRSNNGSSGLTKKSNDAYQSLIDSLEPKEGYQSLRQTSSQDQEQGLLQKIQDSYCEALGLKVVPVSVQSETSGYQPLRKDNQGDDLIAKSVTAFDQGISQLSNTDITTNSGYVPIRKNSGSQDLNTALYTKTVDAYGQALSNIDPEYSQQQIRNRQKTPEQEEQELVQPLPTKVTL